jgi:hypothetical protein
MNPKLLIALALSGAHFAPENPFLCSNDAGGDAGGGGGGEKPAKTFTQAEVDSLLTARLAREKSGQAKAIADAVAAEAAKRTELEQKLADLEAQVADAGKSGAEKAAAEAARAAAATKTKLDAKDAEIAALKKATEAQVAALAQAKHAHRVDLFKVELHREFLAAKAMPSAVAAACDLLVMQGELAFNDDGKPTVKLGADVFDKPGDAVKAFLKGHPYFAAHPGGGIGTTNNGTGMPSEKDLEGMSSSQLLAAGMRALRPQPADVDGA